jgi:hypothetical protein
MIKDGEFFVQILPNNVTTPNQDMPDGVKGTKGK